MKNKILAGLFIGFVLVMCASNVNAIEVQTSCCQKKSIETPQEALRYKKLVSEFNNRRSMVYNALNLSNEQVTVKEDLYKLNSSLYETKFNELIKESYTLKALKMADADTSQLREQKKIVKNIKEDIDNLIKEEDKTFKKCLTREQRSKYSMIRKLERKEYKSVSHQKDYYKSNPKMRPFGNPKSCSEIKITK